MRATTGLRPRNGGDPVAVKGPNKKAIKDSYEPAPAFKKSPHSGPGVGGGGDKMSQDRGKGGKGISGPRRK